MAITYDPSKVIAVQKKYVGYLEKKTNAQLNSMTANAGSNNYTRFGRDYDKHMNTKLNGQAWCAMFQSETFVEAYGLSMAKKLLGGNLFSYTPDGYKNLKAKKRKPKKGDLVFFYSKSMGRIAHVGLVYKVDSKYFYTYEGNTSSDPGVVRNGGSVNDKKYPIGYELAYFGTPGGNVEAKPSSTKNTFTAPGADETLKKGSSGSKVKWLQFELNQDKASIKIDGVYGDNTVSAVKSYQKRHDLTVDGIAGPKTIAKLKRDGK